MAHHVIICFSWILLSGLTQGSKVTVEVKPKQKVLTLLREEEETLTCNVTKNVPDEKASFSYTWSLDNGSVLARTASYRVSGKSAQVLVSAGTSLNKELGGYFTCTVTAKDGEIIGNATIRVEIHYPMTNHTGVKRVREGTHADICLNLDSAPPPTRFVWRKLGRGGDWGNTRENKTCPRFLPFTQLSDGGLYEIQVYNNMTDRKGRGLIGMGVTNITIKILFPPKVDCEEELMVEVDQPIVIKCNVTASPSPRTITWYRNNTTTNSSLEAVSQINTSNSNTGPETTPRLGDHEETNLMLRYRIEQAKLSDSGFYQCVATNVMDDYTGRLYNGTGNCLTRLIVTEPVNMWTAYMFYLIGGGVAILFLATLICIGHRICRRKRRKAAAKEPSVGNLQEADKFRTGSRTVANSYTDTGYTSCPGRISQIDVQQSQRTGDNEDVDVNLYSWGNDFDDVDSCSNLYSNVKKPDEDIYLNTPC